MTMFDKNLDSSLSEGGLIWSLLVTMLGSGSMFVLYVLLYSKCYMFLLFLFCSTLLLCVKGFVLYQYNDCLLYLYNLFLYLI